MAVPILGIKAPGIRQKSFYGIVVNHSSVMEKCAIFFEGKVGWFDNVVLMPLWSIDGTWLQLGKLGI